jgi:hypothetical protein
VVPIRPDWYGVEFQFDVPLTTVVGPIRADTARRLAEPDPARWLERWAHHFIDLLTTTDIGPPHAGSWTIRPVGDDRDDPAPALVPLDGMSPLRIDIDKDLRGVGQASLHWYMTGRGSLVPLRPFPDPTTLA